MRGEWPAMGERSHPIAWHCLVLSDRRIWHGRCPVPDRAGDRPDDSGEEHVMTWKSGIALVLTSLCIAGTASAQVPGSSMQPGGPSNPSVPPGPGTPGQTVPNPPVPNQPNPARPSSPGGPPTATTPLGQTPGVTPPCVPGTSGQPTTGGTTPPCVTVPGVGGQPR